MTSPLPSKIPVTVLGATGVVGQRLVRRLANHPWFEIAHLAASERSVGKRYRDACAWHLAGEAYAGFGDRVLVEAREDRAQAPLVFSALDTGPAREIEPAFAGTGAIVCSNAAAFRMDTEVPLLIPEVNAGSLSLIPRQRARWKGAILCNPNCTTTILALALAPLHAHFGVEAVLMTSLQAISGAGHPGVPSLDILANVVPHIAGEESKVEAELPKLLSASIAVSAMCTRVPVLEGHTEAISARLKGLPSLEDARSAMSSWHPALDLPSAPSRPLVFHETPDRPQPRLDAESGDAMAIHIGRLRACPLLGLKFIALGSNTERGAAGGAILNAELAVSKGLIQ